MGEGMFFPVSLYYTCAGNFVHKTEKEREKGRWEVRVMMICLTQYCVTASLNLVA